jgi:hypothetical protein
MHTDDLQQMFDTLRPLLARYQPPLVSKHDDLRYLDLWSSKDLVIEGRQRKEVFFAGLIIQKRFVGFYFMPVYSDVEIKDFFQPELLRRLKGKSCFHINKLDAGLLSQIDTALQMGYALYQRKGWI